MTHQTNLACTQCKKPLAQGDAFCSECGAVVTANQSEPSTASFCPKCKEPISLTDDFCSSCGSELISLLKKSSDTETTQAESGSIPSMNKLAPLPMGTAPEAPVMARLQPIGHTDSAPSIPLESNKISHHVNSPTEPNLLKTTRRGWNATLGLTYCQSCFYQGVKNTETHCQKCGARFLTQEETAAEDAENAKTDADRAREKAQAAMGTLTTTSHDKLASAANTRAGKNLREYWVGWTLIAAVLLGGIFVLKTVVGVSQRRAAAVEEARQSEIVAKYNQSHPVPISSNQSQYPQTNSQPLQVQWVFCPDCHGRGICASCDPAIPINKQSLILNGSPGERRAGKCLDCGGSGKGGTPNQYGILPDCTHCRGTGHCPICGGTGQCQTCDGAGRVTATRALEIQQFNQQMQQQFNGPPTQY